MKWIEEKVADALTFAVSPKEYAVNSSALRSMVKKLIKHFCKHEIPFFTVQPQYNNHDKIMSIIAEIRNKLTELEGAV